MKKATSVIGILIITALAMFWLFSNSETPTAIHGSSDLDPVNALIDYLGKNGTSGALLLTKDDTVMSEAYWSWPGQAVTRNTLFDLGSIAKQFTGFLVLLLEQEKKLSIAAQVKDFLPETAGAEVGSLRIEDLLHMTSGLPHNEDWKVKVVSQLFGKSWESTEIINELKNYRPAFTPGEKLQYSNLGYVIAAQIVSRIEGKSFAVVLKERIFQPFQMSETYLQVSSAHEPTLARGRFLIFNRWLALPAWNYSFLLGAGGIISNVRDLWKWNQNLKKFFDQHPELASRYYGHESKFHYGYGWEALSGLSAHAGESPGFCAYVTKSARALLIITLNSDFCASGDFQDKMNNLANATVRAL